MMRQQLSTAVTVLGVLLLAALAAAGQASGVDASEASAFMGTWTVTMETPLRVSVNQTVTIRDTGGKIAVTVGADDDTTIIHVDRSRLVIAYPTILVVHAGRLVSAARHVVDV
jgi:hypothetical protein